MKNDILKIYSIDARLQYLTNDELLVIAGDSFNDINYCKFIYAFLNNDDIFTKSKERCFMREIRKQITDYSKPFIQLSSNEEAPKCLYINSCYPLIKQVNDIKEYRFYNDRELFGGVGIFFCELNTSIKDSKSKFEAIEHIVMNRFNSSKTGMYSRFVIAIRCSDSETWEIAILLSPEGSQDHCKFTVTLLCDAWLLVKCSSVNLDVSVKCNNVHVF